jgi:pre-rRNA-processing protein TSR3
MNLETCPPTIIVVHQKERREKCSVEPLRDRPDVRFYRYPLHRPIDTTGYLRLSLDGNPLSIDDRHRGLLVLDASWRLAGKMEQVFAKVEGRTLPPWKTAYPRRSKAGLDPDQGLATIEAIYLAYRILGRPTTGLLDHYHWRESFLELNGIDPSRP